MLKVISKYTYLVIHKKDQYLSAHSFFFILVRIYRYKQLHIRYRGINCDKLISKFNVSFSGKHLVHSFEKDPNFLALFCFVFLFFVFVFFRFFVSVVAGIVYNVSVVAGIVFNVSVVAGIVFVVSVVADVVISFILIDQNNKTIFFLFLLLSLKL